MDAAHPALFDIYPVTDLPPGVAVEIFFLQHLPVPEVVQVVDQEPDTGMFRLQSSGIGVDLFFQENNTRNNARLVGMRIVAARRITVSHSNLCSRGTQLLYPVKVAVDAIYAEPIPQQIGFHFFKKDAIQRP